jgi:hypothetical protein
MVAFVFTTPPMLLSTGSPARMLQSEPESYVIDVPADARVTEGAGGDEALVQIEWERSRVRVYAHRETAAMTARDYGVELWNFVPTVVAYPREVRGEYGTLAGKSSPFVYGFTGADAFVALCAAPAVTRLIVIGSHRASEETADELHAVIDSLAFVAAAVDRAALTALAERAGMGMLRDTGDRYVYSDMETTYEVRAESSEWVVAKGDRREPAPIAVFSTEEEARLFLSSIFRPVARGAAGLASTAARSAVEQHDDGGYRVADPRGRTARFVARSDAERYAGALHAR